MIEKNTGVVRHQARVFNLELEACGRLFESINTPRSLTVHLLVAHGEWDQLLDLTIDPNHYDDHQSFSDDYLVTKILSKNPRLPTLHDKRSVAIKKFRDAEARCARTNAFFTDLRLGAHNVPLDDRTLLLRVQHIIQKILGAYPRRKDLDFAESKMRFGPGATTSLSGVVSNGKKYGNRSLDCTTELVSFRTFCFPDLWKQNAPELNIRDYSKLTTVPKNAKTDRCICIEPDLNIYVQLGIGSLLREKLRGFGLNLQTQNVNQLLAKRAKDWGLCTVDLAAASDTIALHCVEFLLPPAWVDLLAYPRVSYTEIDGKVTRLEKWSSMGNGYTFELETLIFYATALAVVPEDEWWMCTAYGDDCILPDSYLSSFKSALNLLGFEVNEDKTFGKGRFHESCGTDWFDGHNVRPFFLRSLDDDFVTICYLYANNARRWSHRRNGGSSCDARCLPFWLRCFSAVRPDSRFRIPEGFGDVGFVTDFDRATPNVRRPKDGWGGYQFFYRRIAAVEKVVDEKGCYISFLSGNISEFSQGREALRGRRLPATKALGYVLTWPSLGPWT